MGDEWQPRGQRGRVTSGNGTSDWVPLGSQGVTLASLPLALDLGEKERLAAAAHSSAEGTQRPWGHRDGHMGKSENGTKGLGTQGPCGV